MKKTCSEKNEYWSWNPSYTLCSLNGDPTSIITICKKKPQWAAHRLFKEAMKVKQLKDAITALLNECYLVKERQNILSWSKALAMAKKAAKDDDYDEC